MKYQTISLFASKGAIYYVTIATVIFSRVKISCFRAKAPLVFHWCLYDKKKSLLVEILMRNGARQITEILLTVNHGGC